ncbi:MAG: sensor domain-containing diguanylate cyclase, partial [Acidimicrobiia bacterium]|nr:sensor domain-containing diguanylate cyclase [Acidimicrobiia bacterium]
MAYLAVSLLLAVALLGVPDAAPVAYAGLALASLVAAWVGVRTHQPSSTAPWRWYGFATGLFLLSGGVRAVDVLPGNSIDLADVLALCGYGALIFSAGSMRRSRTVRNEAGALLDALTIAGAAGVTVWLLVLGPFVHSPDSSTPESILAGLFLAADLCLIAAMARIAFSPGRRTMAYYLVAAGGASVLITDTVISVTTSSEVPTGILALAALPFAFAGAAALHPSMSELTETVDRYTQSAGWRRLGGMLVAVCLSPVILLVQVSGGDYRMVSIAVCGWLLISVAAILRMAELVRERQSLVAQQQLLLVHERQLVTASSVDEIVSIGISAALDLLGRNTTNLIEVDLDGEVHVASAAEGWRGVANDQKSATPATEDFGGLHLPNIRRSDATRDFSIDLDLASPSGPTGRFRAVSTERPTEATQRSLASLANSIAAALEARVLAAAVERERVERRFRSLVQNSADVVAVVDRSGVIQYMSPVAERVLGLDPQIALEQNLLDQVVPGDRETLKRIVASVGTQPRAVEARLQVGNSDTGWFDLVLSDQSHDETIGGVLINLRDASDRHAAHRRLMRSEKRFRALVQNSSDIVAVIDERNVLSYVSPAISGLLGVEPDDLHGRSISDLLHDKDHERWLALVADVVAGGAQLSGEFRMWDKSRKLHVLEVVMTDLRSSPEVSGIVVNARDVTAFRRLESDFERVVSRDALTGLLNREGFQQTIDNAIGLARSDGHAVGVLMLNLSDFKAINDGLGQSIGDEVLSVVAERLGGVARVDDSLARISSEDFGVMLPVVRGVLEMDAIASRIRE